LRGHFAAKRGAGKTGSLEAIQEAGGNPGEPTADPSPLDALEQKELAALLTGALRELKPPLGDILADFSLHGRSYDEIARRHGLAMGSVGVYLKRGLGKLRTLWPGRGEAGKK
jgi:DNA-directed RNA polymerase specialized sigma24 family protein